jgi:hypothetical protein
MEPFRVRRCRECGEGSIRPVAKPGRTMPYRTMHALGIPAAVAIPTCDRCGSEWIDEQTATDLDEALEKEYRAALRARLEEALQRIGKIDQVSRRRIEHLLGLSEGYLSRIAHDRGNPSAQLVSALALVAEDPERRIDELEKLWNPKYRAA